MAELELAVAQHVCPVEALGPPYRSLRAFRPLLFVETEAVPSSALLAELPPSAVLHHLYSRAPPALASPHTRAGLSAAQYSGWMDQHSELETWKGYGHTPTHTHPAVAWPPTASITGGTRALTAAGTPPS
jgi:hypothetical protein